MAKGEIAHNEQFRFLQQCFVKSTEDNSYVTVTCFLYVTHQGIGLSYVPRYAINFKPDVHFLCNFFFRAHFWTP